MRRERRGAANLLYCMERSGPHGSGRSWAGRDGVAALLAVAPRVLDVDGVAVSLVVARSLADIVAASDPVARELEVVQARHAEGPAITAAGDRTLVEVDDLDEPGVLARWPRFAVDARQLGVHGVASVPLRLGASCLGAVTAHRLGAGTFDPGVLNRTARFADLLAPLVTERSAELADAEVHQAEGMVAIQLGVGITDAAAFLRASAFTSDVTVERLARDVVARRVRFDLGPSGRASDTDPT